MAATRSSNMKPKSAIPRNASPSSNSIFERKRRWIKVQKQFEGFAYDGANVRLEFVDPDGSGALPAVLTTRYFSGPGVDNIIAQENFAGSQFAQGTYWHMKNYLGSTTDLIAAAEDGGHQNHITYDSYGNVASQTNASVGSRYMYTGREYDAETGLQYNRARYYDSSTGRFLSEDPIGFAAGPNQYEYVKSAPLESADPWGLKEITSIRDLPIPTPRQRSEGYPVDFFYGEWGGAKLSGGRIIEHIESLPENVQQELRDMAAKDPLDQLFKDHDFAMTDAVKKYQNSISCPHNDPHESYLDLQKDILKAHRLLQAGLNQFIVSPKATAEQRQVAIQAAAAFAVAASQVAENLKQHGGR